MHQSGPRLPHPGDHACQEPHRPDNGRQNYGWRMIPGSALQLLVMFICCLCLHVPCPALGHFCLSLSVFSVE